MPIVINEPDESSPAAPVLEIRLSGTVNKDDYAILIPAIESMLQKGGKARLLVKMHDFHGWTTGAAWEDLKYDIKFFHDIEKLAIVGETRLQHLMTILGKPFNAAEMRYFDHTEQDEALAWLQST